MQFMVQQLNTSHIQATRTQLPYTSNTHTTAMVIERDRNDIVHTQTLVNRNLTTIYISWHCLRDQDVFTQEMETRGAVLMCACVIGSAHVPLMSEKCSPFYVSTRHKGIMKPLRSHRISKRCILHVVCFAVWQHVFRSLQISDICLIY